MSFADCLASAVEQGEITQAEARDLNRRFEQMRSEFTADRGAGAAGAEAKARLTRELQAEAVESRRIVALSEQVRARLMADITGFATARGDGDILEGVLGLFEHFGFHGYSSVEGRTKSIFGGAATAMEEALASFDKTFLLGQRRNRPQLDRVVRELFGDDTGDPAAKRMARAFADVSETLRQRFNAAGGAIGKLEGWGLPQVHDARALVAVGRERWKVEITPRLDLDRMRDPLTGDRLTPSRLDSVLDKSYDRIVTGGEIDLEPSSQPARSSLSNQRAEHRFLHFKSAADWQSYAADFGQGDPFASMMNHLRGMARDIAALEVLGPNPGATVEWLKQVVKVERAKAATGAPSLWKGKADDVIWKGGQIDYRIDALWGEVRGLTPVSGRMAMGAATLRSTLTSALLGSAVTVAIPTDPIIATAAKRLSGLPTRNWLSEIVSTFTGFSREEAVRSGLILEDAMHVLGQEARYAGSLSGPVWSNWLAERTLNLSGLNPWTQARKHLFGMEMQGFAADQAGKAFADLDPRFSRMLDGYGIRAKEWNVIRGTAAHSAEGSAGVIRPIDVMERDREIGERFLEAIIGETERAVPSGTKRARAYTRAGTRAGTFTGEALSSFLQFKSFALSLSMLQMEAISHEAAGPAGRWGGAAYAGKLALGLTLAGALGMQIRQISQGKDAQPMDDWRFWLAAAKTGGGFGLYGDFLFADATRFNHDLLTSMAGPAFGLGSDLTKLTLGNLQKAIQGDETKVGADAVGIARRYMPVLSSLAYTRAGYNRVLMDQLQYVADPEAHQRFRQMERKLRRDYDQGFWWRPGELAPARMPDVTGVAGR